MIVTGLKRDRLLLTHKPLMAERGIYVSVLARKEEKGRGRGGGGGGLTGLVQILMDGLIGRVLYWHSLPLKAR